MNRTWIYGLAAVAAASLSACTQKTETAAPADTAAAPASTTVVNPPDVNVTTPPNVTVNPPDVNVTTPAPSAPTSEKSTTVTVPGVGSTTTVEKK